MFCTKGIIVWEAKLTFCKKTLNILIFEIGVTQNPGHAWTPVSWLLISKLPLLMSHCLTALLLYFPIAHFLIVSLLHCSTASLPVCLIDQLPQLHQTHTDYYTIGNYFKTSLFHYTTASQLHSLTSTLFHCSTAPLLHCPAVSLDYWSPGVLLHRLSDPLSYCRTASLYHYTTTVPHCSLRQSPLTHCRMIPLASLDQYSSMPPTKFSIGTFSRNETTLSRNETKCSRKNKRFQRKETIFPFCSVLFSWSTKEKQNYEEKNLNRTTVTVVLWTPAYTLGDG